MARSAARRSRGVAGLIKPDCSWCGQAIPGKPVDDHGVKYHVSCLARRRATLGRSANPLGRPFTKANRDTQFVIRALESDAACFACLVTTAGLPEVEIVDSLRQLRAAVMLTVGACSRCGGEDRLLCGLVAV